MRRPGVPRGLANPPGGPACSSPPLPRSGFANADAHAGRSRLNRIGRFHRSIIGRPFGWGLGLAPFTSNLTGTVPAGGVYGRSPSHAPLAATQVGRERDDPSGWQVRPDVGPFLSALASWASDRAGLGLPQRLGSEVLRRLPGTLLTRPGPGSGRTVTKATNVVPAGILGVGRGLGISKRLRPTARGPGGGGPVHRRLDLPSHKSLDFNQTEAPASLNHVGRSRTTDPQPPMVGCAPNQ